MKQLKQKNSLLYLLLLCVIACAVAVIVSITGNSSHTAFAATGEYDSSVKSSEITQSTTIVVLQKNGGSGGSFLVTAIYGEDMPEATAPTWEYHIFIGYFSEKEGGTQYYDQNMNSTHIWDITDEQYELFAHWETEKYTVYFKFEGGEGGTESIEVEYGGDMPSGLIAPTKVGYDFLGYFTRPDGEGEQYYDERMVTDKKWLFQIDGNLYAKWKNKHYDVILDNYNGEEIKTIQTYMTDMVLGFDAPTKVGCTFNGYYAQPNGQGTKYYNADMSSAHVWDIPSETTIYAYWTELQTIIIYNLNGGKNNSANPSTINYNHDRLFLAPATRVGHIFDGWYMNGVKIEFLYQINEERITLEARWNSRIDGADIELDYDSTLVNLPTNSKLNYTILLPKLNFNGICTIIIPENVDIVHIYSTTGSTYYLNIKIEARSTDFELILENLTITLPTSTDAESSADYCIDMKPTYGTKLILYTYGFVAIKGRNGADGNIYGDKNGGDGKAAINCNMLKISYADDLLITGGNGGMGVKYGITDTAGKAGAGAEAIKLVSEGPQICDNVEVIGGCSGDNSYCAVPWTVSGIPSVTLP